MIEHTISSILLLGIMGFSSVQGNYIRCFDRLRDSFQHPLKDMNDKCVASNVFGPFLSQCVNPGVYSFTRSANIAGELNDYVYPVLGGTVVGIGRYFPRSDALTTVIIKHSLGDGCVYEGQPVSSFFTIYGHIVKSSIGKLKVGDVVTKEDVLGTIGPCDECQKKKNMGMAATLQYQVRLDVDYCADFDGDCGRFGAPVHTLVTRPSMDGDNKEVTIQRTDGNDGGEMDLSVAISTPCTETDIVQYYVECGTQPEVGDMVEEATYTLNLNSREGFDPVPGLYKQNMMVPFIDPEFYPFYPRSGGKWKTNLKIPTSWFQLTNATQCCYIEVEDLSGVRTSDEYCGPELDGW